MIEYCRKAWSPSEGHPFAIIALKEGNTRLFVLHHEGRCSLLYLALDSGAKSLAMDVPLGVLDILLVEDGTSQGVRLIPPLGECPSALRLPHPWAVVERDPVAVLLEILL